VNEEEINKSVNPPNASKITTIIFAGLPFLAILALLIISGRKSVGIDNQIYPKRSGTAIVMTGAAARIPQEAALLEELYNRGLMKNVVFISGVSSGALNSVALI
jgi:predicted acylesterase/phospholipase RssA